MKKQFLFFALPFLFLIQSCGNTTTPVVEETAEMPIEEEIKEDASTAVEQNPQEKEIKLISIAIADINRELTSYTRIEKPIEDSPCETTIYTKDEKPVTITKTCADGSLSQVSYEFYIVDTILVAIKYSKEDYNAPPYYTKTEAAKEGVTEGYFDESLTKKINYMVYKLGTLMLENTPSTQIMNDQGTKVEEGVTAINEMLQKAYEEALK